MIFRFAAAAVLLAATAPLCAAFSTNLLNNHAAINKPSSSSLKMGPPIDSSAPITDLYGEGSRKYRRTVYTHNEWVKHRSSDRFFNNVSTLLNSGIYKNIGQQVFATTTVAMFVWLWNMLVGGYEDFSGVMHDPLIKSNLATAVGLPLTVFTTLSPSLGLLLVFRTNTSYNRWDEARKFWGLNINHTRDLNRMATAWYGNDTSPGSPAAPTLPEREIDPEERAYLLGQVSLFTWAFVRSMKRHLSPPDEDEEDYVAELKSRLTPEQSEAIISAAHRPNRALYDLSVAIEKLPMHFMRKNEINKNLSIFEDTLGGSERLLSSPVPLFYSRHTARFISVWLLFLPFALYSQFGDSWNHITMIPATAMISLFLFGIEELATQLEEPFTILPMQGFCDKIGNNCNEIVSWAGQDLYEPPEAVVENPVMEIVSNLGLVEGLVTEVKSDVKKLKSAVPESVSNLDTVAELVAEVKSDVEQLESPVLEKVESTLDVVDEVDVEVKSDVEDELPEMELVVEAENDIEVEVEVEVESEDKLPEMELEAVDEAEDDNADLKVEAVVEEIEEEMEEEPEMELPEVEMESAFAAEDDNTDLKMEPVVEQEIEEEMEEEPEVELPEMAMESDGVPEDDLTLVEDETKMDSDVVEEPVEEVKEEVVDKQPEMEVESVSEPEPETTKAEDETPLEWPEVKMADDWNKPKKQKSLRELVQGL